MKYTALMMDVIDSKKLSKGDREEVQFFIKKCLDVLNKVFKPSLVFDVVFSAGDEFQGLFEYPYSAVLYFRLLRMLLFPLQIRCGIGVGDWDVKIPNGTSSEQDGLAYHYAREAINEVRKISACYILLHSDSQNDLTINTLLNASIVLAQKQSTYQTKVSLLIELMNPFYDEYSMDLHALKDILSLIQIKDNNPFFSGTKKTDCVIYNTDHGKIKCDPVQIFDEYAEEYRLFFESTIKKGLSSKIAALTDTTRQNIDNIIKSAHVPTVRNIDLTALIYIYKNVLR